METDWERTARLPAPAPQAIEAALAGWAPAARLRRAVPLAGGLVNLNWRLELADGPPAVVLRAYLRDPGACSREAAVLRRVAGLVPAPTVHHAGTIDLPGHAEPVPCLLLEPVDGAPLAGLLARDAPEAHATAGRLVGAAMGRLHGIRCDALGFLDAHLAVPAPMEGLRAVWHTQLMAMLAGRAGARMGTRRRAALLRTVESRLELLAPLEGETVLLHADCKPTNVLVDAEGILHGLIDWEFAWAGPPLFDLGQMRRWPLPSAFETAWIAAYEAARGPLPPGWRARAALLDLMNLVGFLDRPAEQPRRHADVRRLIDRALTTIGSVP